MRSEVVGTAPNRRFVIEWRNVRFFGGGGNLRFQIVLTEDSKVLVQYHTTGSDSLSQGSSATAGVENAEGTVGLQYSFGEAALFSGMAIRYSREPINDPTPPTVAITAPVTGAMVGGLVNVAANATDNLGVVSVGFYLDRGTANERFLGSDTTAPYQVSWNTLMPVTANGPHVLTARAIDVGENATESTPVMVTVFNDTAAPTVQITAPTDGSTVMGPTTIRATATDNVAVTRVDFRVDGLLVGSDSSAPFEFAWTPTGAAGSRLLTAVAFDAANNSGTSSVVRVTFLSPGGASFDTMLRAPRCSTVGPACDSGGLVNGRAALGPEVNQPNTIGGTCADGTSGVYHSDESLDRLRIETLDGTPLGPNKQVRVTATVWAFSGTSNFLDVYHTQSVSSPMWTLLGTLQTTGSGLRTITGNFFLPAGGNSSQAIRGNWRYGGTAGPCTTSSYDDRDDLIFAVPPPPDPTPPTAAITSPPSGTNARGLLAVTATASDNISVSSVALLVDGTVVSTDTTAPYEFSWDTATLPDGVHQLVARATDGSGNIGNSAAVSVTTDNTAPAVAITSPESGSTVSGTVPVNATASDATAVAQVQFFLDGAPQFTATMAPYVWSWNTAGVAPGMHTLTAVATDSVGNQTTSAAVTVNIAQPSFVYLWPEAESGNPTAPLQNLADVNASGGRYIQVAAGNNSGTAPPATGRATYTFTVPTAGTYKVWGRVIAPSTGDDSFWVIMDGGTPLNWNNITNGPAWHWDDVHNGAVAGNPVFTFNLTAGSHTLVIAYREDGCALDRLLITNDSAFVPTGTGPLLPPPTPSPVTATAGDGQITVSWGSSGLATYAVRRGPNNGPYEALVEGLTGTSHPDTGLTNGTEYCYVVTATNSAGTSLPSAQACATPSAAPAWLSQDVGAVAAPGSFTEMPAGTYTLRGSGADIWGTADEFRYAYRNVTGDVTITARVASIQNINAWTKAGVMIREGHTLAANARNVMALVSPTAANMYRRQVRATVGGTTASLGAGAGTAPVYLRVVRAGNTFTASYAPAATGPWTNLGAPLTLALSANTSVGLAVTSHADGTLADGVFDNVTITTP